MEKSAKHKKKLAQSLRIPYLLNMENALATTTTTPEETVNLLKDAVLLESKGDYAILSGYLIAHLKDACKKHPELHQELLSYLNLRK